MKIRKFISLFADIFSLFLFIYLLVFPDYATENTVSALYFCFQTLIPSLFIYMVLAKIIVSLPIMDKITSKIGFPLVCLILGTVSGSPIGAKIASDLYDSGRISKKEGEFLYSFTNNASLSFVMGFIGLKIIKDIVFGIKLAFFQFIASCFTAVFMKYLIFGKEKFPKVLPQKTKKTNLKDAISDSALTMLNLCACVVFFIVAGNVLTEFLNLNPFGSAVLKSLLEFSSGCASVSKTDFFAKPIVAFAIGQTGLSVALQVKSVIGNRFAFRYYFMGKSISCLVVTVLTIIFG